jgi:hypothetical protein
MSNRIRICLISSILVWSVSVAPGQEAPGTGHCVRCGEVDGRPWCGGSATMGQFDCNAACTNSGCVLV